MALGSAEKASLALRIIAARHLDDRALPAGGTEAADVLREARNKLRTFAENARRRVMTDDAAGDHLRSAADDLEQTIGAEEAPGARVAFAVIAQALAALRATAAGPISSGDGSAWPPEPSRAPRICGLLDAAGLVEARARASYQKAGVLRGTALTIHYETGITPDDLQQLRPFRVAAHTDIARSPRLVSLTVKDDELTGSDLCQLGYVLHHELVCHALQRADGTTGQANAPHTCHWTEGWMDALAFDLAVRWAKRGSKPHQWLPYSGPDARDAMGALHASRYADPDDPDRHSLTRGLSKHIRLKDRRAARSAFEALRAAFGEIGLASDERDAEDLVQRFSMIVNADPTSTPHSLRRICTHLQNALLSLANSPFTEKLALACFDFLSHRDLKRLEAEAGAAMSHDDETIPSDPRFEVEMSV